MRRNRRTGSTDSPRNQPATPPAGATPVSGGPQIGDVVQGERETTASSGFGNISFFTVDSDGCIVRLDLTMPTYRLSLSAPNYNAKVALLLAAWVNRSRVTIEYSTLLRPTTDDAPRTIVGVTALPAGSDGS